ncbi:MAG: class I SAM-dependent methyltransferase [Candidatus Vogelbacteria bacterium]|nr:class I SAM-dependent methyltransferase [Candidatus Vogelbacteria bacterium]
MLISKNWKEYEVLDAGDGAKLERWGYGATSFILSRPDPQLIWPKKYPQLWTRADGVYTRNETGSGKWKFSKDLPTRWHINYRDLKFWVSPTDFKHTGIFPEQAVNWDWIRHQIGSAGRKINMLNLFAYTGGATIAALSAGASVCHVDASAGMIDWTKENAKLNGLEHASVRYIFDDAIKFVEKEKRRGVKYDAVIMDPPSYGRGTRGQVWKIEKMLWPLIESCKEVLSSEPIFFLISTYTTGLGITVMKNILESSLGSLNGDITSDEIAIPIRDSDFLLPAGITTRWYK